MFGRHFQCSIHSVSRSGASGGVPEFVGTPDTCFLGVFWPLEQGCFALASLQVMVMLSFPLFSYAGVVGTASGMVDLKDMKPLLNMLRPSSRALMVSAVLVNSKSACRPSLLGVVEEMLSEPCQGLLEPWLLTETRYSRTRQIAETWAYLGPTGTGSQ